MTNYSILFLGCLYHLTHYSKLLIMSCIYQRSKYYAIAKLDPLQIVEPIGYKYLSQSQKPKITIKKKEGEALVKYISDSSLNKQLSQRGTPFREIERYLKITQSTQRKNFNLNGQNLEFANQNLTKENLLNLREAYFPSSKGKAELLSFLQLVGAVQVLRQYFFSIRDYALSTYFVYYQGENLLFYDYLQKSINQEFIEYENEIIINCPQLSRPQLRKIDYTRKENIENYISEIIEIGREKDDLFGGVHLYISDDLPLSQDSESTIREEAQLWSYLHFQITVLAGILNQGQHAIVKMGGSFTQKTVEYLFLLKLAFSRIYLHKNILSNPFSNEKYVICQGFNKDNGRYISRFLLENFDAIRNGGENILMVQLKAIYANDFHTNINDFNNLSPIIKISKEIFKEFNENCNISYFPNRQNLSKKIQKLRLYNLQETKTTLQELIPECSEKKKVEKEPLIIQKEAEVFDFEAMMNLSQPSKKAKETDKGLLDLSSKKQDPDDQYIQRYISNGNNLLKIKKEEARKKRAKQKQQKL